MRVLLSGYYGFGNLGDEALLDVIVTQMRARFPAAQIDVLSATPEATAQRYGVEATPRWSMRSVREAVARADVVLSGGGGLLQTATSARSVVYYAGILREAIRLRRKTMVFAQSIGPLDLLGRIVVRSFCRGLDRATVRDARSLKLLQSLLPQTPAEQTADPVFLYDLPVEEIDLSSEGLGGDPYAIVSVRKISNLKDGQHAIARAVDRLASVHGVRVAFLPLGGASDAEVSTAIIRLCKSAPMLLPECSLERAAAILRGARVVIGMRLHALILAARFAVPFLAIPYDPKVAALCDDLGYPLDPLWTPGRPAPSDPVTDALVDRLMSQRDALAAELRGKVAEIRAAAARNFDVLGELMRDP
ncbi:MAG TPA: polysaccharide pyruvyl transferase CsaB [Candidatus Acidoferrales bacterium]|nr:polysaccharide pyruvyl transferase CsaB [Candidatus Acidoferrales bacterium]